ncbi:uncharacterized protein LOC121039186 [Herpailurus yagouaroundi]|uniref:uncharacterized protein LOC121039186 n=1 Tax=Herpailurus yagouaroundi TaxID=1608482 RepID=UPI001AD62CDF|nr:uncharacterized protein LOC121039186 [Puma yagouaroundi]
MARRVIDDRFHNPAPLCRGLTVPSDSRALRAQLKLTADNCSGFSGSEVEFPFSDQQRLQSYNACLHEHVCIIDSSFALQLFCACQMAPKSVHFNNCPQIPLPPGACGTSEPKDSFQVSTTTLTKIRRNQEDDTCHVIFLTENSITHEPCAFNSSLDKSPVSDVPEEEKSDGIQSGQERSGFRVYVYLLNRGPSDVSIEQPPALRRQLAPRPFSRLAGAGVRPNQKRSPGRRAAAGDRAGDQGGPSSPGAGRRRHYRPPTLRAAGASPAGKPLVAPPKATSPGHRSLALSYPFREPFHCLVGPHYCEELQPQDAATTTTHTRPGRPPFLLSQATLEAPPALRQTPATPASQPQARRRPRQRSRGNCTIKVAFREA